MFLRPQASTRTGAAGIEHGEESDYSLPHHGGKRVWFSRGGGNTFPAEETGLQQRDLVEGMSSFVAE